MTANIITSSAKYLFFDLLFEAVRFPFWWYTAGAKKAAVFCWRKIVNVGEDLALGVWLANLFTPMFGQQDWQGIIISFFIRLIQIIFRSLIMLLILLFFLVLFLIWLILPVFVVYQVIITING